jgi:predicted PurR-regulated permease PerM
VELLRAQSERRFELGIRDPSPVKEVGDIWTSTSRMATIGTFLLLLMVTLYFSRGLLLPILAAAVIGTTLAPLVTKGVGYGVPRWLTALILVGFGVGLASVAITLLAGPVTDWVARAPEIGAIIKQRLFVFDAPLAAFHALQKSVTLGDTNLVKMDSGLADFITPAVAFLTPAAGQTVLFLVTLVFMLVGQLQFRNFIVMLLAGHDAKLRFLRISNDIERNLAGYLTVVTAINLALGVSVTLGTWLIGFPNPVIFGLLAMILNYVPYLGPAVMATILFAVGLISFPTLGHAAIAPLGFIALATIEGQIVMPMIVGRRLTLNPLVIFFAVAFWAWMWGPIGAFLAVPLSIVGLVTMNHIFPRTDDPKLPE